MPKPFFSEDEKLNVLTRIAKGEDLEELASSFGITFVQLKKYTYNHKREFNQIQRRIEIDSLNETLPPLDRVGIALGPAFEIKGDRVLFDKRPITLHESIKKANSKLKSQGKQVIFYPWIQEPENGE